MILSPPLAAEKLQNFFGVFLQFYIGVDNTVNTTKALASGTRLMINNKPNLPSTVAPSLGQSHFSNEIIVNLNAGDTITLQIYGILDTVTLLPGAAGATLSIIRLS